MFVENYFEDFYKLVIGKRLLLLANCDVDAVCACRILQTLLRSDNILYTLVPVQNIEELVSAYKRHSEGIKHVLLINCGGTIDVIEALEPDEDVLIFISDSHRPTDVCNIYSSGQVRLFGKPTDDEGIPEFQDIFHENEEDSEENEDEEEEKEIEGNDTNLADHERRMRQAEDKILRRREKRLWEENRKKILFEYTQFSYYGRPSSMEAFDISWHLGKDSLDCLWWAIVGVTYQIIFGYVVGTKYVKELATLHLHVSRLTKSEDNEQSSISKMSNLKISSQQDLHLALYRHWTVQSSIRYSPITAVKLRLWTIKGEHHLQQLLAEMGLPLSESKQHFCAMDSSLRKEFIPMIEKVANNYDLQDLIYPSFTLSYGYRNCYQASDYVYALLGLLESASRQKPMADCFSQSLDSLSRNKSNLLQEGIESSKKLLSCIFRQVQTLLDMKQVISAGPFFYFALQEGSSDVKIFSCPDVLILLAKTTLQAYHSVSRNRKSAALPLIASAPFFPLKEYCVIVGVPPVSEAIPRSFFGKAFVQAAEMINSEPYVYFDSTAIKINASDRPKFFDALASILS